MAVVVWTFAIVLVTRLLDPPWIFIGQLLATGLILRYALRHEDGRYRRAGLAVVGGSMVGWGLTVIAAVHVVTPYAAVVTATGCALIGAVVWGVVSRRPLWEARSPG